MKNFKNAFFLGLTLLGLTACGGGGSNSNDFDNDRSISGLSECEAPSADQAVVCGAILANDGVTPLVNAEIRIAGSAKSANGSARGVADPDRCLTDEAGDYVCYHHQFLAKLL